MTPLDKDNMFSTMAYWNLVDKWSKDDTSELPPKDKQKLRSIANMIIELLRQFGKREGKDALYGMLEESKKFDFIVAERGKELGSQVTGTFNDTILKGAVKRVLDKNDTECLLCDRTDYKNCEWYTLHNLVEPQEHCKGCPFKKSVFEFIGDKEDE